MIIKLPFSGFYESKWSEMIDHMERMELEYFEEREKQNGVPEEVRLVPDEDNVWEAYFNNTDYSAAYWAIAKGFVDAFNEKVKEEIDFDLGLSFETMKSPREYNFETDRIFAYIPRVSVAWLAKRARRDGMDEFAKMIRLRHSSRDGFILFYSNDFSEWKAKRLSDYDHNELETLLLAVLEIAAFDLDAIEWSIYENWLDSGYSEWSNAVDWEKVEADLQEMRNEKREALISEDRDFEPP